MRGLGAVIEAPKCDIGDINVLRDVVEAYRGSMPQVAGCNQSSMVLKDSVLANMSHEDWTASTKPKSAVPGNLHTVLPKGLDFSVLLSSISGIVGWVGQANYAAANTYMDALAHYRHALGERAVALDLGAILDHGVLATNEALRDRILRAGILRGVSSSELLALLDDFCGPSTGGAVAGPHTAAAQVAIGLAPASELKAASPQTPSSLLSLPFYRHVFASTAAASPEQTSGEESIQAPAATRLCVHGQHWRHRLQGAVSMLGHHDARTAGSPGCQSIG
ncbi:hypothetical protein PFICI_03827 [Pestalotiopsis fici W106-1]|uniref:Ketoreductase domain-containing protein n=1 Tax=Pestalotiopsis fici (strain W106-1 / CGMCC3.15140) TaxID=1229662 RepID=W3XK15_PESFW|nr:uncharacterized protein PFICI_03827 [Pestalotiopsis fici W106-1]ETS85802.1 hypothetical protein PFICI_03827 [Pestalotiopsis fici W106-1]